MLILKSWWTFSHFSMLLVNRASAADSSNNNNKQKKTLDEWILINWNSCLAPRRSYVLPYWSFKCSGIKYKWNRKVGGALSSPSNPCANIRQRRGFCCRRQRPWGSGTFSPFQHTRAHRFAETCCLSCFLVPRFHRGSHTHLNHPRLPCIFVIYLSSVYVFIKQVDCFPGL